MKFRDRPGKALTCAIASPDFMPKASSHALTHRAKSANRGGRSSLTCGRLRSPATAASSKAPRICGLRAENSHQNCASDKGTAAGQGERTHLPSERGIHILENYRCGITITPSSARMLRMGAPAFDAQYQQARAAPAPSPSGAPALRWLLDFGNLDAVSLTAAQLAEVFRRRAPS
jgi:hypothetical protein